MKHLTPDLIQRWRFRRASPQEILAITEHLAMCETCRGAVAGDRSAAAIAEAIDHQLERDRAELTHLGAEVIERWVDGTADAVDRELVESHFAICRACRQEAEDLARFAAPLMRTERPARRAWWLGLAAAAALVLAVGTVVWWRDSPPESALVPVLPAQPSGPEAIAAPASALVLSDGNLRVFADGAIEGVPDSWRAEVSALLARPELVPPAVALAVAHVGAMERGDGAEPALAVTILEPTARVVLDPRPTFRWQGPAPASYLIEVYDSQFNAVAASQPMNGFKWQPEQPLPRGDVLTWKVTMISSNGDETFYPTPPMPPAAFAIVSEESSRTIEAARTTGSRLLTGLALWRAGVLDAAAAEFGALRAANPDSELARRLAEVGTLRQVGAP